MLKTIKYNKVSGRSFQAGFFQITKMEDTHYTIDDDDLHKGEKYTSHKNVALQ